MVQRLFVIARNTSFTYKGRSVDVKKVARELGAHFVLEGSVRKAGNRVRITAQLIEGETAAEMLMTLAPNDSRSYFLRGRSRSCPETLYVEPPINPGRTSSTRTTRRFCSSCRLSRLQREMSIARRNWPNKRIG